MKNRREFMRDSGKVLAFGAVMTSSIAPLMADSHKYSPNPKDSAQDSNKNLANKGTKMQYLELNNGVKMPILGYGTFQIPNDSVQRCVEDALSVGYRLIDTAQSYGNERGIGDALKNAIRGGIKREDIFITTKLSASKSVNEKDALKVFESSLKKLGVDYVDLYLIHQPYNDSYGAWRTMSRLHKEGKIRAIGVSNFLSDKITDFCLFNGIKPAINQIEMHPFYQQVAAQKINNDLGVAVQSWASFAEGKDGIFTNKILKNIGEKYGKTPAQVILRWLIERNVAVIPKTTRKARMKENIAVFDFALTADDKAKIAKLDKNKSLFIDHRNPKMIHLLANRVIDD